MSPDPPMVDVRHGNEDEFFNDEQEEEEQQQEEEEEGERKPFWKIGLFLLFGLLDLGISLVLLTPLIPWIAHLEDERTYDKPIHYFRHYTFSGSLLDLAILAGARLLLSLTGLLFAYCHVGDQSWMEEYPGIDKFHPNGEPKSREELKQEALEETCYPWFCRYTKRPSFGAETLAMVTQITCIVKCLARMNVEIGTKQDAEPIHPGFWLAVLAACLCSFILSYSLESVCKLASEYGQVTGRPVAARRLLRQISSTLSIPLLGDQQQQQQQQPETDAEQTQQQQTTLQQDDENVRGISDIGPDTAYKAAWSDLIHVIRPDTFLLVFAFVFLLAAAVSQVYIPRFLGNILDALAQTFNNDDDPHRSNNTNTTTNTTTNDNHDYHNKSMWEIPGFMDNVKWLVVASVAAGIFSGLRGSIFTIVGARANVRLRVQLMDALLSQDIGFFDVTRTGDITSRLSSDTTLVGDQVTLNVNVFLRSLVQAFGVLLFMFLVSWQLSLIAFISVPAITIMSKWYGNYIRDLTNLMQKKLADGNSVSEAAISSMATVRAFDAAELELAEFERHMQHYLDLNTRSAIAYFGYAAFTTAVPQLVFAVVVFYGGLLVRNGDITSGQLVSFLLYLQSLADAFASIGYVFSSLTQAVGAADKVFELKHRKPKYTPPSILLTSPSAVSNSNNDNTSGTTTTTPNGILGIEAQKTRLQRTQGLRPANPRGAITLENVEMYYPARPRKRVLNGLSLQIQPGSIVALVGQSGGGKSSVMSLIQHLYEHSQGKVMLDGQEVHNIAPAWLARNISIVSQEPTLFARSIRRNIVYGLEGTDSEPTQEDIERAAQLANAHDFIMKLPQKYDTECGERGVQLSGGQKQRIAIARALVRKPKVLLLDEATSALDAESEHLVQQAIDDMLARGKNGSNNNTNNGSSSSSSSNANQVAGQLGSMTVLIVAHRLSTVRNADTIFVIHEGRVVEQGRHTDLLLKPNGAYAALIRRQMEAQEKLENAAAATATTTTGGQPRSGGGSLS